MNPLEMCLQASAMIVVVLAVRAAFLKRLPKAVFLVLWAVVLARLLVPLSLPAPLDTNIWSLAWDGLVSLGVEIVPDAEGTSSGYDGSGDSAQDAGSTRAPSPDDGSAAAAGVPSPDAGTASSGVVAPSFLRHIAPWKCAWAAGSIALAALAAVSYARHGTRFSYAVPVEHPSARRWLEAHRLLRPLRLKESPLVSSPITYGVLHPTIVVPAGFDWDDPSKSTLVLEHEFVHVTRFDAVFKALLLAAVCIYWFNPLVWALYLFANRDIELSCDERVARRLNRRGRSLYAHALIDAAAHHARLGPLAPVGFGKNAIEERIVALGAVQVHSTATGLATVALVGCLVLGFATTAPLIDLVESAPRPTVATVADLPASVPSGNDLVSVYDLGDATRLVAPHYSVDVPDGLAAGGLEWSFSKDHVDPAPAQASDVLVVRDGATGGAVLVAYLVEGRVYAEDVASIGEMPGYARAAHGGVPTTQGERGLVVAVPEASGVDAGLIPADPTFGTRYQILGLDERYAGVGAPTEGALVASAADGAHPVRAVAVAGGLRIETPAFYLTLPAEYVADGLRVSYREGTFFQSDAAYGELGVRLPDGRAFCVTCADASHEPNGGPQTVFVPVEGAPAGTQVYVSFSPASAAGGSAEDAAAFASWVACRG